MPYGENIKQVIILLYSEVTSHIPIRTEIGVGVRIAKSAHNMKEHVSLLVSKVFLLFLFIIN